MNLYRKKHTHRCSRQPTVNVGRLAPCHHFTTVPKRLKRPLSYEISDSSSMKKLSRVPFDSGRLHESTRFVWEHGSTTSDIPMKKLSRVPFERLRESTRFVWEHESTTSDMCGRAAHWQVGDCCKGLRCFP